MIPWIAPLLSQYILDDDTPATPEPSLFDLVLHFIAAVIVWGIVGWLYFTRGV